MTTNQSFKLRTRFNYYFPQHSTYLSEEHVLWVSLVLRDPVAHGAHFRVVLHIALDPFANRRVVLQQLLRLCQQAWLVLGRNLSINKATVVSRQPVWQL